LLTATPSIYNFQRSLQDNRKIMPRSPSRIERIERAKFKVQRNLQRNIQCSQVARRAR
jgi:hypothetical protein